MERESTAPCVSPEISDPDAEQQAPSNAAHRFPFIDIDSLTSLVGHDDVYEIPPELRYIFTDIIYRTSFKIRPYYKHLTTVTVNFIFII